MKKLTLKLTGTSPLLHSCDRLADPLDPATIEIKKITTKGKKKTEDDHLQVARLQWEALLYFDAKQNVVLPTANIRAAIIGGAKLNRLGASFKRGLLIMEDITKMEYGKNLTVEQLWKQKYLDRRTVVIGGSRVMCYRPKFIEWSVQTDLLYDESVLDHDQIVQAAENAGKFVGIGGYRPEKGGNFGRFTVEVIK